MEEAIAGEFSDGMFEFGMHRNRTSSGNENTGSSSGSGQIRRNIPVVTIALIVLNVVYYLILTFGGSVSDSAYMLSMGANFGPLVFRKFEVWRLVTSLFMHFSLIHLGSNMLYLAIAGYNLEKVVGRLRFLLIYLLSGIGGNLISAAWYYLRENNTISGGASGAIYGLIGSIALLTFLSFRKLKPSYVFARIAILLVFVFYSSFARTGVDGAAHIGGFFFGILLTFLLVIGGKKNEK